MKTTLSKIATSQSTDMVVAKLLAPLRMNQFGRSIAHTNAPKALLSPAQQMKGIRTVQTRYSAAQPVTRKSYKANQNSQRNMHQMVLPQAELEPTFFPGTGISFSLPKTRHTEMPYVDCEVAEMSEMGEIVQYMCKHFLRREPLLNALKVTAEEAESFVEFHVKDALQDGASFVARDDEGEICGVRLNAVGPAPEMGKDVELSPKLRTLKKFLEHTDSFVPQSLQGARMRHIAICVNRNMARSGLATMMMKRSVEYSKRHRLRHMVAMCSGNMATGLALKMGFRLVKEIPYTKYIDPTQSIGYEEDQNWLIPHKPFLSLAESHVSAKVMVRNV